MSLFKVKRVMFVETRNRNCGLEKQGNKLKTIRLFYENKET